MEGKSAPLHLPAEDAEPELRRYLRVLWERRLALVASLIVGAGLYLFWLSGKPKIYEAGASIVVERAPPQLLGGETRELVDVGPGQYYGLQDYIQTQRRIITSDAMARKVITQLKLLDDREFWGGPPPARMEDAVAAFVGATQVRALPDTQILVATFDHRVPEQAKRAVDALVDTYIEANAEKRDVTNAAASRWLADQEDDLRKRLAEGEQKLYEFKRKNELLSVSMEDRVNNVRQQIDKLTTALTEARLRRASREAEADEIRKQVSAGDGAASVGGGELITTLKKQLFDEERRLSELQARYEDTHPLVRQQLAKTASARKALEREQQVAARQAEGKIAQANEEERKIAAQLEAAKQEGLRMARLELEYGRLSRETTSLAKQYQIVQNRTNETALTSKVRSNNLSVLDYARVPNVPVSPNVWSSATAAALLSLLLGIALAFLLDALDRSIKTQAAIEKKLALPFLGNIPRIVTTERRELVVTDAPSSPAAEALRLIRTNLLFADINAPLRRIMVTSAIAGEGKTLTTISLAQVMAQLGTRVLVVDCDLRRPRVSAALGVSGRVGLTDVALGAVPLDEAVQPTAVPNLFVLPSGPVPPNPAELVDAPRFAEVIAECAQKFDRVLIDTPPSEPVTDPTLIARYCDGIVLVYRAGRTSLDHARRGLRHLGEAGTPVLGAILNDVDVKELGYGYRYGYVAPHPPSRVTPLPIGDKRSKRARS